MDLITKKEAQQQGLHRYFNGKPCRKGHISEKYVSNMACVECRNIKNKSLEYRKQSNDVYGEIGSKFIKSMWWRAKKRSDKSGIEFDIELCDIKIPKVCPVFGFEFEVGKGKGPTDKSPSLDRIDNKKGYIKNNIQVISFKANRMKSDCDVDDVEKLFCYMKSLKD